MKKLSLYVASFLVAISSMNLSAQAVADGRFEGIIIDTIPVDPSLIGTQGLTANHKTYRVFVDMAAGYELQTVTGVPGNPLKFETSTYWWNDVDGESQPNTSTYRPVPQVGSSLYHDSWMTLGGISSSTSRTQLVPFAYDADGTVNGYTGGAVALALTWAPGSDAVADASFSTGNGVNFSNDNFGYYVGGGVTGPTPENIVCIGQFTTDGQFSMDLNFQIRLIGSADAQLYCHSDAQEPYYVVDATLLDINNRPDAAPTVSITGPATINKNATATISTVASDDNSLATLAFYVNGILQETFTTTSATTTHDFSWVCLGGSTVNFTVIATDNSGKTTTSNIVTAAINDPCPIVVTAVSPALPVSGNLAPMVITVTATDCDEPITNVTFSGTGITSPVVVANDGDDTYSFTYTPTVTGAVTITATATNTVNATQPLSLPVITITNDLPTAVISTPIAPSVTVGNDTTFVVNASDIDGSVASVTFEVVRISNGVVTTVVDNTPLDGFSYTFTGTSTGVYSIRVRAIDDKNANGAWSAPMDITVTFPAGDNYALESVTTFCSSSDVFCLPLITVVPVTGGVIGYDVDVKYDNSKVTPTGLVTSGEDLISDRDYTGYKLNVIGDTLVRISFFINSSAPAGTVFQGQGTVFCMEFSRNYTFADVDTAQFDAIVVSESYATTVIDRTCIDGFYASAKETIFNGTVSFWSDNSKMVYVEGVNDTTEIFGNINPSNIVTTNATGAFQFDINNGTSITFDRDITNSFDMQTVISGQDAYYTALVAVEEDGFKPNIYQIIAMDVNRDGRITAGDITQIQQRTVSNIGEFAQSGSSKDWVFVPSDAILNNVTYRISSIYPLSDGVGYSRNRVPYVTDLIELPIENATNCPIISDENYKGILLGDVTGNYAAQPASTQLKSGLEEDALSVELGIVSEGIVYVNITASSSENIESYDFSFYFDDTKYEFFNSVDLSGMNEMCSDTISGLLKCTAYNFGKFKSGNILSLRFKGEESMSVEDIQVKTSLINEKEVTMTVKSNSSVNGIVENSINANIFPNPTSDVINVEVDEVSTILLMTINGIVIEKTVASKASFNASDLAAGTYIVKVITANSSNTYPVIVE